MDKYSFTSGVDLIVPQHLRALPVAAAAGAILANDPRGTNQYIYTLLGATSFWRYDTINDTWQQLANPNTFTFAAACDMIFDPSRGTAGYIWLLAPSSTGPYAIFQYYDIANNTWTSRNAPSSLGAQFGTDAALTHTCSTQNASGNDDYIYLTGNNVTTWYRYSIGGNTWTAMGTALPAAAGAGCALTWLYSGDSDKLLFLAGGATAAIYLYSISGATFAAFNYLPNSETYTTGTNTCYLPGDNDLVIVKDATHRTYLLDIAAGTLTPLCSWPYTAGTAIVGDGLVYAKMQDLSEWLYYRRHSGQEFWRMLIG